MLDALDYLIGLVQDGVSFNKALRLTVAEFDVRNRAALKQMFNDAAPVYGLSAVA